MRAGNNQGRLVIAFVDESGDPGLKCDAGSSPYFVVVLVIFDNVEEAHAVDKRIDLLRREMRLDQGFEFRFSQCRQHFRLQFLTAVAPYEFFYYGIVIDKAELRGKELQHKESFYKYASGLVFENAKAILDESTVVIDGSGSKDFRRQLEIYLKRRINDPKQRFIRKVRVQDSARNNLLQLADMVAGTIYRSFGTKDDARLYRSIIGHREMNLQVWPE